MVALITGASSGMGLEYARQLAAKGYELVTVSNKEDELLQVAEMLRNEYGAKVTPHYQDLATYDAAQELFDWCNAEGIEVEILINNAGTFFFQELSEAKWKKASVMMSLHMTTPVRLCMLFGDEMKKRGHGKILNMSSMAATLPAPGIAIYAATKAFLKNFGISLYYEMKPYGVSVTTVCPAAIATPLYNLREDYMKLAVMSGVIKTPAWLVKRALRGMERGKKIVKPAFMNIYLPIMFKCLPDWLEYKIWKKLK